MNMVYNVRIKMGDIYSTHSTYMSAKAMAIRLLRSSRDSGLIMIFNGDSLKGIVGKTTSGKYKYYVKEYWNDGSVHYFYLKADGKTAGGI